jgi:broad specificity phosphatase PhoE
MRPLYLLRHGPTAASVAGAPLGHLDLPVTAAGWARWPGVKARLLALGIEQVLTSDLARARDHALDLGLPVTVLPGLAEQAFGTWEALPWQDNLDTAGFFQDPVGAVPPGGESFLACAERALAAFQGARAGEQAILVLAHGGPLRALLAHSLGLPLARALDLGWDPFGLSRVDLYSPDRGVLRFHNLPLE